jgi:hypothetical protein
MKTEKGKKFCKILICGKNARETVKHEHPDEHNKPVLKQSSFEVVVWFNVNCKRIEKKKKKKNFAETPCSLTQCDLAEFE